MNESRLTTIEQIEQFLSSSMEVGCSAHGSDTERDAHPSRVLTRFDYPRRKTRERGVLRGPAFAAPAATAGHQLTRLVASWHANRVAQAPLTKRYSAPATRFTLKYMPAGIAVLIEMDKAHEDTCGPANSCLLQGAYSAYGDSRLQPAQTHQCWLF